MVVLNNFDFFKQSFISKILQSRHNCQCRFVFTAMIVKLAIHWSRIVVMNYIDINQYTSILKNTYIRSIFYMKQFFLWSYDSFVQVNDFKKSFTCSCELYCATDLIMHNSMYVKHSYNKKTKGFSIVNIVKSSAKSRLFSYKKVKLFNSLFRGLKI